MYNKFNYPVLSFFCLILVLPFFGIFGLLLTILLSSKVADSLDAFDIHFDVTENKEYTFRQETKEIARSAPLGTEIQLYVSRDRSTIPPNIIQHINRVERAIATISKYSDGRINATVTDLQPDTELAETTEVAGKKSMELYKKGLIYKDKKLVNWDTVLKTAISDLEVDQREVNSKIYYIRYPIDGTEEFITIATTRPETMLGDTAIAVNPKDERFKSFVGKTVTIPIVGRKIKIIEDDYADPEQGTGALKITPAHDFNDYDVGQRNNLEIINIFTEAGKINENAPKNYVGLDRFEARKRILKELKEKEFFEKEENIKNKVPYGDRSSSIIEPFSTEQWSETSYRRRPRSKHHP